MPILDVLMNVRPAIEEGVRSLLASQGLSAYTRQNAPDNFQDMTPRIEITAKIGAATGHKFISNATTTATSGQEGVLFNDAWNLELIFRAVTRPQNVEPDNLLGNEYVARLRGVASTFAQSTWTDTVNFPNHLLVEPLRDSTTDDTLQADDNDEFSVLSFSGIVQIRTDSWNN